MMSERMITGGVILVVDDEPGVLRLCQRLLEKAGFTVVPTTSTSQALAILSRELIQLLLVDVRMPGIDGFQLMDLAHSHQAEIAVLLMTGYGTIETALEALQRGADGLILKPFSGSALVEGARNALLSSQKKRDFIRLQALRPLFDVTGLLFTETEPLHLRGLILDALIEHLHCTEVGLFWQNSPDTDLELIEIRGEALSNISPERYRELAERLWARKAPMWVTRGAMREGSHMNWREQAGFEEIFNDYSLSSFMCVPVVHTKGSSLLIVARSASQPPFQEADLDMFTILARQATLALENANLYGELRTSFERLEKSQHGLIQAEKMAAAGRLTASIAHEINNPLQAVSNCLHLACRNELSSKDRRQYLDLAMSELERLTSTVQRVLDLYRPGARDPRLVDVDDIFSHVLLLVDQQLKNMDICVRTDFQASPYRVVAVRNHLQQVLLNLIINSMEAMPDGGELFLKTCRLDSEIEIIIEDTGPGIPEENWASIFEPFVSTKENGTGLGLTVSYGIVNSYAGSLEIIHGSGKGACFRVLLPIGERR